MVELDPKIIKKIIDLNRQGMNYTNIGKELGLDYKTARKYCILYNDREIKDMRTHEQKRLDREREIADLYNSGVTKPTDISLMIGVDRNIVADILAQLGLREKRKGKYAGPGKPFNVPMPPLKASEEPVYYPDRECKPKKYTDRGKNYLDVSEVFGL